MGIIPDKYDIIGPDGTLSDSIEGELSIRDRYDITIRQIRKALPETLVAAAVAVDARERN